MSRNLFPLPADERASMDEVSGMALTDRLGSRPVAVCPGFFRANALGVASLPRLRAGLLALALTSAGAAACDGTYRPSETVDTANGSTAAAVRVRLEGGPGPLPDASVLAFKATLRSSGARDVLGLVDPLASQPPLKDCELRDLAAGAGELVNRGESVDLEELPGVTVTFTVPDAAPAALRPSARLFPDITAALGGVVSESGPTALAGTPAAVTIEAPDGEGRSRTAATAVLPSWPHLKIAGETPKAGLISFGANEDLVVSVAPAAATTLEMRPFGTTALLACAVPPPASENAESTLVVSRVLLARLAARSVSGRAGEAVPLAFDVVRRSAGKLGVGTGSSDLVVEVRLSGTAELRP